MIRTKIVALVTPLAILVTGLTFGVGTWPADAATGPSVSIADPGALTAGNVQLQGTVNPGPATDTTTVLYVVDASGSTGTTAGTCGDVNGDGAQSILDCEATAVVAVDNQLAGASGQLLSGLEAFSGSASVASLQTSAEGDRTFAPPGYTGGLSVSRMTTVAAGVRVSHVTQFIDRDLTGRDTDYADALSTALSALATAPTGPKWIFFLSDGGRVSETPDTTALSASGVKLRSFDLSGNCRADGALVAMASATQEQCVKVTSPGSLAGQLTGSQPDSISGVTVSIGGVAVAANVDPVGGWKAGFTLGQGTYTVTATAHLRSGAAVSSSRVITVGAAAAGSSAPPPGAVSSGAPIATRVHVATPPPLRRRLPARVHGMVSKVGDSLGTTAGLNGATVALQGRGRVGQTWVTYATTKVSSGKFLLSWHRHRTVRLLRVVLRAHNGFAESSAPVPTPPISACSVKLTVRLRVLTCHTTAKKGTHARLLRHGSVLDRSRVAHGVVSVHVARGRSFSGDVLSVDISRKHHVRLHL